MNDEKLKSFKDWLWNRNELITKGKIIPILSCIISFLSFAFARVSGSVFDRFDENAFTYCLIVMNSIILIFAIFTNVNYSLSPVNRIREKHLKCQKDFDYYMKGFWLFTLILYLFIGLSFFTDKTLCDRSSCDNFLKKYDQEYKKYLLVRDSLKVEYPALNSIEQLDNTPLFYNIYMNDSLVFLGIKDRYTESYKSKWFDLSKQIDTYAVHIKETELSFSRLGHKYLNELFALSSYAREYGSNRKHYKQAFLLNILQIIVTTLGNGCLFFSFIILYNSQEYESYKRKINFFWIAITLSLAFIYCCSYYSDYSSDVYKVVKLIAGIIGSLSMSLLVARFESSAMKTHLSILVILFLYAIIQSLFGLFGNTVAFSKYFFDDLSYIIAIAGKTLLYLYVLWIFSTKRISQYFDEKLTIKKSPN